MSQRTVRRPFLWILVAVAAIFLLGGGLLFSGSQAACDEMWTSFGPGLRCALEVAAPPEEVWSAFTGTGEPRPYYFDAVLQADLRPGGRWRFVTDDLARLLAGGEVLVVERPRRFVHTFAAADLEDAPSRIAVELAVIPGGTRVELVHDRFTGATATYRRFRRAHPLALSAMKSFLETGRLPLRARLYTAIFEPGMKLFTARAEPWAPADSGAAE